MAMASDTLSISKDLRAAGFDEQQADALAMHMAAFPQNLVTKEDLTLEASRLDHKIDQAESRLEAKIEQVESKLEAEMHRTESRLLLRLGAGLAVAAGLVLAGVGTATAVILNQLG